MAYIKKDIIFGQNKILNIIINSQRTRAQRYELNQVKSNVIYSDTIKLFFCSLLGGFLFYIFYISLNKSIW